MGADNFIIEARSLVKTGVCLNFHIINDEIIVFVVTRICEGQE